MTQERHIINVTWFFIFRSCFNLLFAIQMRNMLGTYGKCMKSLTLTESEFVHPQTLNPFALACKNLESLVVVNPVVNHEIYVNYTTCACFFRK